MDPNNENKTKRYDRMGRTLEDRIGQDGMRSFKQDTRE